MSRMQAGKVRSVPALRDPLHNLYNRFFTGAIEYQFMIDIWEGQGQIDWSLIEAQAAAIRINDIGGGTHEDQMFAKYWVECPILKIPYFVYNPWNTGPENYQWLSSHMPAGATSVLTDLEVVKSGYPPQVYANEVQIFIDLCRKNWNTAIYTAQWFLSYLSTWPQLEYWWAQYPFQFYPDSTQYWTWQRVRDEMAARGNPYPSNSSYVPGELRFWQFSGDRLIVPGSTRPMDLSLFYGSYQELSNWIGDSSVEPPPDPPPNGDNMRTFTNGATEEIWTEFGQEIHVLIIPPSAIEIASFYYQAGVGHVAEELVNNEYKVFFNFTPYDFSDLQANVGLKIDGTAYHTYVNYNPWLSWIGNQVSIDHRAGQWKYKTTASQGWRYIFENGAKANTSSAWDQRVARRVVAGDQDGNTIIFTSTGDRPEGGLTLHEVADIFSRWVMDLHGAVPIHNALDGDSGHSAQIAFMADNALNVFSGPEPNNRNQPPAWGYIRLKTPLITKDEPTPPDPEPQEPVVDVVSLAFDALTKSGTLVYTVDGEERSKDF